MIMMQAHEAEPQQGGKSSSEGSIWDAPLFLPVLLFLPRLQLYSTPMASGEDSENTRGALDTCASGHEICKCMMAAFMFRFKHMQCHWVWG